MTDVLTRPRVDPRIAGRWVEARRQEGRRRLRRLLSAGALVGVAGLAAGSLYSPLFELRHIRLSASSVLSVSQVATVAGVRVHEPLIDLDTSRIVARLDGDPTLGGAVAKVIWPGTLQIGVSLRSPVAVARLASPTAGRRWAEVDPTGRVIALVSSPTQSLPQLTGVASIGQVGTWLQGSPGASAGASGAVGAGGVNLNASSTSAPDQISAALGFLTALPQSRRGMVKSIDIQGGTLSLQIEVAAPPGTSAGGGSQRIGVVLGDGSHLAAKVVALLTVLDQGPQGGVTGINLSAPDHPVLSGPALTPATSTPSS